MSAHKKGKAKRRGAKFRRRRSSFGRRLFTAILWTLGVIAAIPAAVQGYYLVFPPDHVPAMSLGISAPTADSMQDIDISYVAYTLSRTEAGDDQLKLAISVQAKPGKYIPSPDEMSDKNIPNALPALQLTIPAGTQEMVVESQTGYNRAGTHTFKTGQYLEYRAVYDTTYTIVGDMNRDRTITLAPVRMYVTILGEDRKIPSDGAIIARYGYTAVGDFPKQKTGFATSQILIDWKAGRLAGYGFGAAAPPKGGLFLTL